MKASNNNTLLVVDDDPAVLDYLQKRLTAWRYCVFTATGGVEALACFQHARPELVLTDLYMADGDGLSLLRRIRENDPDVPVLVMSGQGRLNDAVKALRLGAWDYLYKPIEDAVLLQAAVEKALERNRLVQQNRHYQKQIETDLINQRQILVEKTINQEKVNAALKAILDQREIEKKSIEVAMVANLKRYVFPYLDVLEQQQLGKAARACVGILRTNIEQLVSPVSKKLSGVYMALTPTEVKVADLIRQGQSTKAIAGILNASVSTVEKHRNKIRHKLNIVRQKVNLQTFLNSLI